MKKYLFTLLLSTSLSFCYAVHAEKMASEYESSIVNVKNDIEKSVFSSGTKQEMQTLLDILLKNVQNAQQTGKEISIVEQRDNTLNERKAQLKTEYPTVFQKLLEAGDASQWFRECVSLIENLTGKLHIEKNTVLTKLIKIMRYANKESVLTAETKQEREKFLNTFEEKLKQAGQNINIFEQATGTFEEMRTQWEKENPVEGKKMLEIADATQFFIQFTDYMSQPPQQ